MSPAEIAALVGLFLGTGFGYGLGVVFEERKKNEAIVALLDDLYPKETPLEMAEREQADLWLIASAELGLTVEGRLRNDHGVSWT